MNPTKKSILRIQDVCEMTGLSKTTIWCKQNPDNKYYDPDFPKKVQLSKKAVGWSSSEIQTWIDKKLKQREAH